MGGGRKNIAGVFSDIYDPPIPKKMVAPLHNGGRIKVGVATELSSTYLLSSGMSPWNE